MNSTLFLIAQIGFAVVTLVYLFFLTKVIQEGISMTQWDSLKKRRLLRFIVVTIVIWLLAVSIWSTTGMMGKFEIFPLNFAPVIAIPLVVIIMLTAFSKGLNEVLANIAPHKIIMLQNFRIFVEVLLWLLFIQGLLPEQMSFEGRNLDILSGLTAPVVAWLAYRQKISRTVMIVWNLLCLGLLINIVTIAILSTPTMWRVFFEEPANTIVTVFPISFLPGFLVPLAYTLHFFSLKQLLAPQGTAKAVMN